MGDEVNPTHPKKRKVLRNLLLGVLGAVLVVLALMVQAFEIPSSAMEDTLLVGDRILVNRAQSSPLTRGMAHWLPFGEIGRGDVVVFQSPEEPGLYVVKRIIGVSGDRLHLRGGVVYRNGAKQDEPYVRHKLGNFDPYRDDFPSIPPSEINNVRNQRWIQEVPSQIEGEDIVVPLNSFFVMGDNRDVSYDSRYYGFVARDNLVGRPMFIYWSFAAEPNSYQHSDAAERIRSMVDNTIHFFDKTRWSRTFKVVQ